MSQIKNNYNFKIHDWMMRDLHLSGNALLIYAYIYSLSCKEGGRYYASMNYLGDTFNISRPTANNIVNRLVREGLLIKYNSPENYKSENGANKCYMYTVNFNALSTQGIKTK